jgi:hypothetical protein
VNNKSDIKMRKGISENIALWSERKLKGRRKQRNEQSGIIERIKRFIQAEQEGCSNSEPAADSPIVIGFNSPIHSHLFCQKLVDRLRYLFLQWIVCCHLALVMVENPFFLSFIGLINSTVLDYLPKSSNSLRGWVLGEYQRQKDIKCANRRVGFHFPLIPGRRHSLKKHIISLIAHFVDENWKRRHLQLSMSRLYGDHSGENVAAHIVPILREWEIDGRVAMP